jgi:peptide deformylase
METKILKYPDKRLLKVSKRVNLIEGKRIAKQLEKYTEGLCCNVGLSAIQIGIPARVFVFLKKGLFTSDKYIYVINPVILSHSRTKTTATESCFSCPNDEQVKRYDKIKVKYHDGTSYVIEDLKRSARIFQHELDHLNGILICFNIPRKR